MAKQGKQGTAKDVGTVKGSSGGKVGSAYGPNPSDKPAANIGGKPAAPVKK